MDDLLRGLNPAQRTAVTSPASVLQVLAPPGSGKTKTLTARVAYLIAQQGLKPWNIIVCTFTTKTAADMKDRIRGVVGQGLEKSLLLGTFHGIARRFLASYGQHIGLPKDFVIADASDSKAIIRRIVKQRRLGIDEKGISGRISRLKAQSITSEQYASTAKNVEQQEFAEVYAEYEATLGSSNMLDYDDLLLRCAFLLKSHPQCVSNIEAVLIDEFQDTNNVQYELMGLLAQNLNTITIVGDPDQSIYGWRSAEIKNLGRMKQQWPDTLTINLEENYRSSGAILHAAQKVIEQDESRPTKKLQATHTIGERPVLRKLPSAFAEADWLVSEIKRTQALTGNLLQYSDYAVLLRTAVLSRQVESALAKAGMPYRMVGGMRFYDRAEVKIVLDYLRVISQPSHDQALERIINVPSRKIGDMTVKALLEEAAGKRVSLWSLVLDAARGRTTRTKISTQAEKGMSSFTNVILTAQKKLAGSDGEQCSPVDLISLILKKISFQEFLKQKHPEDCDARWANVEELIAQAAEASATEEMKARIEEEALPVIEGVDQRNTSAAEDSLSLFLANITLAGEEQKKSEEQGESTQQVTISTIHKAKGLEWPIVFVPACYEGSIPHSRADDNDEERRLLYVAMTRAQALLYLSCPIKNSQREETTMSSFLTQPGLHRFFEEHGPSIQPANVASLATTLRRDCPSADSLREGRLTLECDEDNYWPLNGEDAPEELAKWNHGKHIDFQDSGISNKRQRLNSESVSPIKPAAWTSAASVTMQQQQGFSMASATLKAGFVNVAARYDELMQLNEAAQLRKIDKRSEEKAAVGLKPSKKQIPGQGSIASFFSKPNGAASKSASSESGPSQTEASSKPSLKTQVSRPRQSSPLHDISNIDLPQFSNALPTSLSIPTLHKPRTAPMKNRPRKLTPGEDATVTSNDYVFLSSSPSKPGSSEKLISETRASSDAVSEDVETASAGFRPASTMHSTTMSRIAPQRKTLGMRRSLQGWSARKGNG